MCCPAFRTSSTTFTTPGFSAAAFLRISSERSREPSSAKTTSYGRPRPREDGQEARQKRREVRLLVVDGHDDGDLARHAHRGMKHGKGFYWLEEDERAATK